MQTPNPRPCAKDKGKQELSSEYGGGKSKSSFKGSSWKQDKLTLFNGKMSYQTK